MRYSWQLTWLATCAVVIVLVVVEGNLIGLARFFRAYDSTVGTVVDLTPAIHDEMRVEYTVASTTETLTTNWAGGASAHNVGDHVTVYYSRSDPKLADVRQPSEMFSNTVFLVALLSVSVATIVTFWVEWYRRTRTHEQMR